MTGKRKTVTLQEEIKQSRPFSTSAEEGAVALLRTADVVRRYLSRVIDSGGITLQQYNVLRILRGAGERGMPTLEIADRMIEETPGITRLLDRLEAKLLVRRMRCLEDRRQVLCWITPEGLELLARLDEPVREADENALGALEPADIRSFISLLETIRAAHRK
jgi:DNA-binding MarR family transcriptional regulator